MVKVWLENKKNRPKKCHAPISHDKHVNENMSNMLCHVSLTLMCGHVNSLTYVPCQRTVSLLLCKVNMSNSITIGKQILAGVKGRVRSNSIYIENLKLVGSVQRGSNQNQNVKFNQYRKTDSCRGQRSGQVIFNLYRKSKVAGECAERLKPKP